MASILVGSGKSSGYYLELPQDKEIVIGREEQCDVQILDDMVSRRHMVIRWDAEAECFKARDDGSHGSLSGGGGGGSLHRSGELLWSSVRP